MTLKHLAVVKNGKIELIDPVSIPEGTKVFIIPISLETDTEETDNWEDLSLQNLNRCYAEDEPEYTLKSLKEYNSNYERR